MDTETNLPLVYLMLAVMTAYGMSVRRGVERVLLPVFSLLAALRFDAVM